MKILRLKKGRETFVIVTVSLFLSVRILFIYVYIRICLYSTFSRRLLRERYSGINRYFIYILLFCCQGWYTFLIKAETIQVAVLLIFFHSWNQRIDIYIITLYHQMILLYYSNYSFLLLYHSNNSCLVRRNIMILDCYRSISNIEMSNIEI